MGEAAILRPFPHAFIRIQFRCVAGQRFIHDFRMSFQILFHQTRLAMNVGTILDHGERISQLPLQLPKEINRVASPDSPIPFPTLNECGESRESVLADGAPRAIIAFGNPNHADEQLPAPPIRKGWRASAFRLARPGRAFVQRPIEATPTLVVGTFSAASTRNPDRPGPNNLASRRQFQRNRRLREKCKPLVA